MDRFLGLMPTMYVDIRKTFKDSSNLSVEIEAGPIGWTIIWADYSTTYCDEFDTSENNFNNAYIAAEVVVGPLREISEWRREKE